MSNTEWRPKDERPAAEEAEATGRSKQKARWKTVLQVLFEHASLAAVDRDQGSPWTGTLCLRSVRRKPLRRFGQRSLLDVVAQAALGAGRFVGVDDALGCRLVQQFAQGSELGPCRIEFLGLDSGLQLFDGSLEGGLRSTVASAALERLAKPLLGTLDVWHDNSS